MIIVIGGIKGGSGKTTIATNLTVLRSHLGKKVLLIDADEQGSSSSWAQIRELNNIPTNWTTIQLAGGTIHQQIKRMAKDYDDIIIDTGGRDTTSQRSCLSIADIYIIPFQPRSLDVWTHGKVQFLIGEVNQINPNLTSYAIINRADSSGKDNQEAIEILEDFCLPITLGQRKTFANAASVGKGIMELSFIDKKAVQEFQAFHDHIYQISS